MERAEKLREGGWLEACSLGSTAPRALYPGSCRLHGHSSTSQTDLSTVRVLEDDKIDQAAGKGSDEGEGRRKLRLKPWEA